jgi:NDP-sugar pyrophosphorylase family protein
MGKRLSTVIGDTPKILAPIGNKLFIDFYIEKLNSEAPTMVYFLTGKGHSKVKDELLKRKQKIKFDFAVKQDEEINQGTAISLKRCIESELITSPFLVLFGDSIPGTEVNYVYRYFTKRNSVIGMTYIKSKYVDETKSIRKKIFSKKLIYQHTANYKEKGKYVDYGVTYIKPNQMLESDNTYSDLKEFLENASRLKKIDGLEQYEKFIEIGNPISYRSAIKELEA